MECGIIILSRYLNTCISFIEVCFFNTKPLLDIRRQFEFIDCAVDPVKQSSFSTTKISTNIISNY